VGRRLPGGLQGTLSIATAVKMSGRSRAEWAAIGAPQSWPMMIAGEPRPARASTTPRLSVTCWSIP
jgi:hypothetical protein